MNRLSNEFWAFAEHESFTTLFQWMYLLFTITKGIVYAKNLQSLGYSRTVRFSISVWFSWSKIVYLGYEALYLHCK